MSVAAFNKFALLNDDEDGTNPTPKLVPATAKATTATSIAPAEEAPKKPRGGPASRSGRYPGRGGGKSSAAATSTETPEDPALPPTRFDRSENRHERGGRGRGRGGRGGGRDKGDRHSRTAIVDSDKQVSQGWGANTGSAELATETAAEADAAKEPAADTDAAWGEAAAAWGATDGAPAADDATPAADGDKPAKPVQEEDNTITYEEYIAKKASTLGELVPSVESRQANEGAGEDLFKEAQKLIRQEHEEYFAGAKTKASKTKAPKEVKEKITIEIDGPFSDQGSRGRGRGRGRGDFRGGDRGGPRGRGRGGGGGYRGGHDRRQGQPGVRLDDESAFPSLG